MLLLLSFLHCLVLPCSVCSLLCSAAVVAACFTSRLGLRWGRKESWEVVAIFGCIYRLVDRETYSEFLQGLQIGGARVAVRQTDSDMWGQKALGPAWRYSEQVEGFDRSSHPAAEGERSQTVVGERRRQRSTFGDWILGGRWALVRRNVTVGSSEKTITKILGNQDGKKHLGGYRQNPWGERILCCIRKLYRQYSTVWAKENDLHKV